MNHKTVTFRVHTALLLNAIFDNALPKSMGILKVPMNQFRILLLQVAERASQINDPIMNKLMCDLTLYDIADPESKDYDRKTIKEIERKAELYNQPKSKLTDDYNEGEDTEF